jgi:16S rRNA (cytidine1402-2'-O)-methyltransferase
VKMLKSLESESSKKNCTQIFIETPYRNNQLLESILKTCMPATRLCIAVELTSNEEWVKTKSVKEWRGDSPDLHKKPTVFLLLA